MYTIEDVLEYVEINIPKDKCRKRVKLDPRNYLVALLHYKYNVTEKELERIFCIERSTINHGKKQPYNLINVNDASFMKHTLDVRTKFPYEFPINTPNSSWNQSYSYRVSFDKELYLKIKSYCQVRDEHPSTALRKLIKKAMHVWEE
jgi:hypothetical protein